MNRYLTACCIAVVSCRAFAAEPITDPFPEKIAKGEIRVELASVAVGLTAPVWLTHAGDGSGRVFIVDQVGVVWLLKDGRKQERPFLDARKLLVKLQTGFDERGLLGLAFHPGFADPSSPGHGRVYTYTSEPPGDSDFPFVADPDIPTDNLSVVSEWSVSATNGDVVDAASRRVVLSFAEPQFNHAGGSIVFDDKGLLYIGTGDGGAAHDLAPGHAPEGNGQSLLTPLGKVLRIDPLARTGKPMRGGRYSVPNDNPFVGRVGLDEIYAYGMRNPWRMSFDRATGRLIAADVGQGKVEEIDIVERGGNYGWPLREGTFYFVRDAMQLGAITATPPPGPLPKTIDPVAQYDHDEGISVTGGFVYRGKAIPALAGQYVFGDWSRPEMGATAGRLFHADLTSGQILEFRLGKDDHAVGGFVIGFGEDEAGELYVLTSNGKGPTGDTGIVWKIVPGE